MPWVGGFVTGLGVVNVLSKGKVGVRYISGEGFWVDCFDVFEPEEGMNMWSATSLEFKAVKKGKNVASGFVLVVCKEM